MLWLHEGITFVMAIM